MSWKSFTQLRTEAENTSYGSDRVIDILKMMILTALKLYP